MKAPKIRFKRFEGGWDIKNLWNNSKISTWTCVTDKETSDNYKYPVISGWKDIMWYYFEYNRKPNTITIARAWTAWFVQLIKTPFYLNDKCFSVISNNEIFNTNFLFFSLKISEKNIMNLRSSTSVPTINTQHLNSLQISLPSLPEQEKIWSLFEQLDSHISKNQQKLEKLKNMKLSFPQKLFPKEWSALPELRFKGFEGAWEEKKIDNICNRFDNLRIPISAKNRIPGSIPYYWANGIQDYVDWYTHNWEFLLIAEDWANDLKNYPIQYVKWKIWVNNHAHVLQWKQELSNNIFLKYVIKHTNIESLLVWWWRAKLNASVLMWISISLPSFPEQEKIWAFFEKLDTQINQQTQKIQKLKNIKQSLLEKMFI